MTYSPEELAMHSAICEAVQAMEEDESFGQYDFEAWYFDNEKILNLETANRWLDIEDEQWQYTYVLLGILAYSHDSRYWASLRLAYEEGEDVISEMGCWAMLMQDEQRFYSDEFFAALHAFAADYIARVEYCLNQFFIAMHDYVMEETKGAIQMSLF